MAHWITLVTFLLVGVSTNPVFADDDDWLPDDDGTEESSSQRPDEADDDIDEDPPDPDDESWEDGAGEDELNFDDDLDFDDELEEGMDLDVRSSGTDTARVYRDQIDSVADMPPDEEALSWERYLRRYPNTVFRARIDERMTELEDMMYSERIGDSTDIGVVSDAGKAELYFAQPMLLENIDPIDKVRIGFEWGAPAWITFLADYEKQINRDMSFHIGIHERYTGQSIEAGLRYALIKSARTRTLVTAIGDVRVGTDPLFPSLRPQLGFGHRFSVGALGRLDLQAQVGGDLAFMTSSDGESMFSPRAVGGLNVTLIPTEKVRIFVETSTTMKDVSWQDSGGFRYNIFTFGIKIMGRKAGGKPQYEVGTGASAPYGANYWGYHSGAVAADMNWYLN